MRQGGSQNFEEMQQMARFALLAGFLRVMMYMVGFYLLYSLFAALFGRKEYRVYDDRTGMVYITDDKVQAEYLRKYGPPPSPQQGPGPHPQVNPYGQRVRILNF